MKTYARIQDISNRGHWMIINDEGNFYVALEDSAGKVAIVNHPDDPVTVRAPDFEEWKIDLANDLVAESGFELSSVKVLYIGVGDSNNQTPGGDGVVFIDDIRLY